MEGHAATNLSLEQMDVETTLHAFTPIHEHEKTGPHIITKGDGIYVTDNRGDTYIDSMASLFCVNAGYGRKEIGQAIADQALSFPYFHTMAGHANEQQIRLSDRLMDLLPDSMSRLLYASSGSEANDANVKLAWMYQRCRGKPEKRKIIGAEHGLSRRHRDRDQPFRPAAHARGLRASLAGLPAHREGPLLLGGRARRERAGLLQAHGRRAGRDDHPGGAGDRLRLYLGARHGRRRLCGTGGGLFRGDPGSPQTP